MDIKRVAFLVFLFTCLFAITTYGQPLLSKAQKEKLESVVLAKVNVIGEVKDSMRSHHRSKPMLMIEREPDSTFKYYSVAMGVSSFDQFRTTGRFCVDPKTFKVYFWDVFADDMGFSNSAIIPVQQWRILKKTSGWQKPHTYRHGKLVVLTN
ncbi:hypothetical protein HQ865_18645 [Mucilaginibacter mali]|uniref:Uncharacterized protein n=1 Tax=Mucilaginibacter mali TaxID=2740462 RepID=A0A7D4UCF5_9SPHI|nr:hypothetical protein [Mucilaginibacter mali]QKJ31698.1 hypothetical protein HQ865_18645 [Mucilaginibacter mali]